MPAENCVILLRNKLKSFGLNLDTDIVGICKVGKLISTEHQLCLAHGVHLAVHDVLYKSKRNSRTVVGAGEGQEINGGNQEVEHDIVNESDDSHDDTRVDDVDSAELNKDSGESDEDDVSTIQPQYWQ